jgi:hypothetical protein
VVIAASLLWSSFGTRPQEDVAIYWKAMLIILEQFMQKKIKYLFYENTDTIS